MNFIESTKWEEYCTDPIGHEEEIRELARSLGIDLYDNSFSRVCELIKADYERYTSDTFKGKCENEQTLEGESFGEVPNDEVVVYKDSRGKNWCFTVTELLELEKRALTTEDRIARNPYNRDVIPSHILERARLSFRENPRISMYKKELKAVGTSTLDPYYVEVKKIVEETTINLDKLLSVDIRDLLSYITDNTSDEFGGRILASDDIEEITNLFLENKYRGFLQLLTTLPDLNVGATYISQYLLGIEDDYSEEDEWDPEYFEEDSLEDTIRLGLLIVSPTISDFVSIEVGDIFVLGSSVSRARMSHGGYRGTDIVEFIYHEAEILPEIIHIFGSDIRGMLDLFLYHHGMSQENYLPPEYNIAWETPLSTIFLEFLDYAYDNNFITKQTRNEYRNFVRMFEIVNISYRRFSLKSSNETMKEYFRREIKRYNESTIDSSEVARGKRDLIFAIMYGLEEEGGTVEEVKKLVEGGVKPNILNDLPIRLASALGYKEMVKYLLTLEGVNPEAKDNQAIKLAHRNEHWETYNELKRSVVYIEGDDLEDILATFSRNDFREDDSNMRDVVEFVKLRIELRDLGLEINNDVSYATTSLDILSSTLCDRNLYEDFRLDLKIVEDHPSLINYVRVIEGLVDYNCTKYRSIIEESVDRLHEEYMEDVRVEPSGERLLNALLIESYRKILREGIPITLNYEYFDVLVEEGELEDNILMKDWERFKLYPESRNFQTLLYSIYLLLSSDVVEENKNELVDGNLKKLRKLYDDYEEYIRRDLRLRQNYN